MNESPVTKIPERMLQVIHDTGNVVLVTHSHPDGDALGSLFGFSTILESLGKKVFCFLEEPVSHLYDFLPNTAKASTSEITMIRKPLAFLRIRV